MHLNFAHNSVLKDLSNLLFGVQPASAGQGQGAEQDRESDVDKTFADYLTLAVAASTSDETSRHALLTNPLQFIPKATEIELARMDESNALIDVQSDDHNQTEGLVSEKRKAGIIKAPQHLDIDARAPSFWRHSFALSVIEQEQEPDEVLTPKKESTDAATLQTDMNLSPSVEIKTDMLFAQNEPAAAGMTALQAEQHLKETDPAPHLHDSAFQNYPSADSSDVTQHQNEVLQSDANSSRAARQADLSAPHLKSLFQNSNRPESAGAAQIENQIADSPAIEPAVVDLKGVEIHVANDQGRKFVRAEQDKSDDTKAPVEKIRIDTNLTGSEKTPDDNSNQSTQTKRARVNVSVQANSSNPKNGDETLQRTEEFSTSERLGNFTAPSSNINGPTDTPVLSSRITQTEKGGTGDSVTSSSLPHTSTAMLADAASAHRNSDIGSMLTVNVEKAAPSATPLVHAKDFVGWVVNRASMISNDGGMEVELRLEPESLGVVRIKMDIVADTMTTRVEVQNVQAKELVESRLPMLQHRLLENGIHTDKMEVALVAALPRADLTAAPASDTKNGWMQSSPQGQRQPAPHRQPADRRTRNNNQSSFLDLLG